MPRQWQPYPNEPQVEYLTDRLHSLQERTLAALVAGDDVTAQRLLRERDAVRERLDELTSAVLRDNARAPRWVEHSDAEAGAAPCLECGNNIPAGESRCSYCGWTYAIDTPDGLAVP